MDNYNSQLLKATKIRFFEQKLLEIFKQGKLHGTIHTCLGQEIIGVVISEFLTSEDIVYSTHRNHGHYIARENSIEELLSELMGKENNLMMGHGGSQHIGTENFHASGLQAGLVPTAAGESFCNLKQGKNNISVCFIGDGTLGQGVLYEVFNIAACMKLPLLFVLEDNEIAQSTAKSEVFSGNEELRAKGFGLNYLLCNSNNLEQLFSKSKEAVDLVRKGEPCFLHVKTNRLGPHSKGDDDRDAKIIKQIEEQDVLTQFINKAEKNKLEPIVDEINEIFEKATCRKDISKFESSIDNQKENKIQSSLELKHSSNFISEQINSALKEYFSTNQCYVIGEDVRDPYGGAFKITKGLTKIDDKRVLNMPISEAAIVGFSFGIAKQGIPTVVELMFGDFSMLVMDQLVNVVSKFSLFSKKDSTPFLLRTPMGGYRGYGSTHSQSLDKFLLACPNIHVFTLNCWMNAHDFYFQVLQDLSSPTIVIENKSLYSSKQLLPPKGYCADYIEGTSCCLNIKPKLAPDITVIVFGGLSLLFHQILEKSDQDEIYYDTFAPIDLNLRNLKNIVISLQKTKKLLFLEEGTGNCSLSSEFFKRISKELNIKDVNVKYINAEDQPIPASPLLENQILPNVEKIDSAIYELIYE